MDDDPRILRGEYVEYGGAIYYDDPEPGEFGVEDLVHKDT